MQYGLYIAIRLVELVFLSLPLRTSLRVGAVVGRLCFLFDWGHRNAVLRNMRSIYGQRMSEKEIRRSAVRVFEHFGMAVAETVLASRLIRPYTFGKYVTVRNEEHLRAVMAKGKGAILLGAHIGNWEVFGTGVALMGCRLTSLYRMIRNPFLDRYVRRTRRRFGQKLLPTEKGLAGMYRVVRGGGYLAILVDQHAHREGLWVDFMGKLASTTPAPALLALRTGAPVMTAYACRIGFPFHYEFFFDKEIPVVRSGDQAEDVRRMTIEITRRIETYVKKFPEQWLWLHRRWRDPSKSRYRKE